MDKHSIDRVTKSGINLFKLIEFEIHKVRLGINLLKVSRIIACKLSDITKLSVESPHIIGVYDSNGKKILIINLISALGFQNETLSYDLTVIICEFNLKLYGFIVDNIREVHRISWTSLKPISRTCPTDLFVAVALIQNKIIFFPDFEMIIDKLIVRNKSIQRKDKSLKQVLRIDESEKSSEKSSKDHLKILCADDSMVIRVKIDNILQEGGFTDFTICSDGKQAYDQLVKVNGKEESSEHYNLIITDIEMPQMDGLTLCRKIKEEFPGLPVIILSSLVSDQLIIRCNEVNADLALSKNGIDTLVDAINKLMLD